MMPIYMDSYPHQRSQVPSGQCYYPSYDCILPQMTVDQAKYPVMCGPWSNGSNYGHMIPCYACSNHGNFPVYYSFNPHTSHFTSSPCHHSCGHHPVFTAPYHVQYPFTPHHSMVQPRYEYDEEAQRDYHCCGCPNHICNQRSDRGVKIEEQEPDIARKNDSLVPINSKNNPYPVMWIPPEYMKKNYEYGRPLESEVADQKNASRNTKSHEDIKSSEKGPTVWNGWSPVDLNSLKPWMHDDDKERTDNQLNVDKMRQFPCPIIWMPSNDGKEEAQKDQRKMNGWFPIDTSGLKSLMKGEDEKGRQNQQVEDKRRQFPYPIIWVPSHSEQGQAEKKDKRDPNADSSAEEPLPSFKFIPVKPSEIDDSMNKSENKKNSGGQAKSSQTMENIPSQKLNSTKKVEVQRKEDNSDETKKVCDAPSKYAESVVTDNPTGTSVRRQLSPQKTSKLPPVSLRVEPLSRKKNGNGSSRSPSPPGSNKQSLEKAKDSPRPSASLCLKENTLQDTQARDGFMNKSKEVEPAEAGRKVVDMADDKNCEKKNEDWRSGSQRENSMRLPVDSEKDISRKSSTKETEKDSYKLEGDKRVREGRDMVSEMATEVVKASHSAEAADGEGLKKKKNLSDVEAAMRIQSAYRGFEVRRMEPLKKLKQMADVREQVTEVRNRIQALESSSNLQKNDRERDVIGEMIMRLLLKLDTIQGLHPSLRDIRKALAKELITLQETLDLLVTKKSKEVTKVSVDPKIDACTDISMHEMQNKEAGIVENSVETSGDNSINMKEKDQSQLSQNAPREEKAANGVHDPIKTFKTEIEEKNGVKPNSEEIVGALAAGDALHVDDNLRVNELRELPIELIEEHPAVSKLEEVKLTGKGENEIEDGEMESNMLSGPNLSTDVDNMMACEVEVDNKTAATKEPETNLLAELPLGVIEDEPAVSAFEEPEANLLAELPLCVIEDEPAVSAFEEPETNLLAELPLGVIEDEPVVSAFEEPETNLLAELPLGVIEDEPVISAFGEHEQTKAGKDETLCHGETIDNVATNTTALMEEDDLVKVMEELPVNAVPEVEEIQPLSSIAEGVKSDEVAIVGERGQEMIDVDHVRSLYSAVKNVVTEKSEEKREQIWEPEVNGKKEDDVLLDSQSEETKCLIDEDKVEDELRCELESTNENAVVATPTSQKSLDEKDVVTERDKKLIEENAKLREMMEKLMEAGKEQLTVISNLTGKVKDLERKLSKNKKHGTRRYRKTPHTPSGTKLFSNSTKDRAASVAM